MQYNIQSNFQYFVAKMLVRLKFISRVPMGFSAINEIVSPQLPMSFDIPVSGGKGELALLEVELSPGEPNGTILVKIIANFSVSMGKTQIYNSHLQLKLLTKPDYNKAKKTLAAADIKMISMELISDRYSMIKDTPKTLASLLPEPFKSMFVTTLVTTGLVMDTFGKSDLSRYLSLYLTGNMQRILDYHHNDIENIIINYAKSESFSYQLDETDFEEKFFAEFGEQVSVENKQLMFHFHPS
ncbi:MAG: hypothetical protein GY781_18270 [Gammaproteobacteria bacterium]|nr:hypothetical protein [Gammaproteobacteria bacterium]